MRIAMVSELAGPSVPLVHTHHALGAVQRYHQPDGISSTTRAHDGKVNQPCRPSRS